ncbi:hypothetical protein J2Z69_002292 [Paenibacillus shirakamiensis]|uniref:Uncharacterized protein n=1 Tax=Paenibacillus shirakamiensis TaxID=1265935 RepID=A0ABS4JHP7_9BACL|nr:YqhG family protein [Paenibacillus shirakamiensis]MBP2001249.1 hypothetical protein [Paenibacillus shirakamiensis]
MTMTPQEIHDYVLTYLESTNCTLLDRSAHHITVKLSEEADKELTGRPYYWGFIERTQTEPETMSFLFVFDPERYDEAQLLKTRVPNTDTRLTQFAQPEGNTLAPAPTPAEGQEDTILGRYFGIVRPLPTPGPGRIQREHIYFGSPKLRQIFAAARRGSSAVYVFEDPGQRQRSTLFPAAYEPWLGACFKVEFACDMKREELHFYGISLVSGRIDEHFQDRLNAIQLQTRLPENVHMEPTQYPPSECRDALERCLEDKIRQLDSSWANSAKERLQEELARIDGYYQDLLLEPEEDKRLAVHAQYEARKQEIRWQYEPRIRVSVINCGIFHLRSDEWGRTERYR